MTASEKSEITAEPEIDIVECFGNSASYAVNAHSWPTESGAANDWLHIYQPEDGKHELNILS